MEAMMEFSFFLVLFIIGPCDAASTYTEIYGIG